MILLKIHFCTRFQAGVCRNGDRFLFMSLDLSLKNHPSIFIARFIARALLNAPTLPEHESDPLDASRWARSCKASGGRICGDIPGCILRGKVPVAIANSAL